MNKRLVATVTAAAALGGLGLVGAQPVLAHGHDQGRPASYALTGDAEGSRFEGIGADRRRGTFYVSEVTGGEIHRGDVRDGQTEEWLPAGADGRTTARGITVDRASNVYVAGGPNGLEGDRPDLWVYSPDGELLAALRVPADEAFLNDVAIGPDGAAYFTDSNDPRVYRVAQGDDGWEAEVWADASGTIERRDGFNLGGIVLSADRSAFVVAQGNTGDLWRFGLDGTVDAIDTGDADLVNADGLVLRGSRLTVVRNFDHALATLRLSADGSQARFVREQATDPSKVFTTATELRGRVLFVESEFGSGPATPPYQVTTNPSAG
ncbi:SMP-30/gluconolactonase/LRE family protein [Isoptericola sp. 4D.3]|uniref:SMP-30/gluconolactonase/LRE family protein n=1 Tax=Isoptericola peretonis TaxID=2918523 RepID=A0ABT0J0N9_9MICO|nr:SMP-30/gluconolactonase/LRE family protein [Isoptericola sp. 4D.3]